MVVRSGVVCVDDPDHASRDAYSFHAHLLRQPPHRNHNHPTHQPRHRSSRSRHLVEDHTPHRRRRRHHRRSTTRTRQENWTIGSIGRTFTNQQDAEAYIIAVSNIAAARAEIDHTAGRGPYTRHQYEHACHIVGIDPMDDATISSSYAVEFGAFEPPQHTPELCIAYSLAARRLAGIRQPSTSAAASFDPDPEFGTASLPDDEPDTAPGQIRPCANPRCHRNVPAGTGMVASRGVVCSVDCYDAMAD